MDHPETLNADEPGNRMLLPGSSSLLLLLIVFLEFSLLTLFSIVKCGMGEVADDAGGTRAYSPADFPDVDFD
jgi:hypothetical protein